MPVIAGFATPLESRAPGRHVVRVVESDQSLAARRVQCKRVGEAMRPLGGRPNTRDFELQPIALFEMMNAAVEPQQELEAMIWPTIHIIW
jgi:hypothetical protein